MSLLVSLWRNDKMRSNQARDVPEALEVFAATIQSKFSVLAAGREEDQLRRPVDTLLEKIGSSRNLEVVGAIGKKSSPLDDITPTNWPPEFTSELLRLLHLLEETLEIYPQQEVLLEQIIAAPLLNIDQLGTPPDEYCRPTTISGTQRPLEI